MKKPRISTIVLSGTYILMLGTIALLFFTPIADFIRINMSRDKYFAWLENERPYLKAIKSLKFFNRRVEYLNDGPHERPYVFYEAVFGDSDGVASFAYELKTNADYTPAKITVENLSLIILPASKHTPRNGRMWNSYWGRYITSVKAAEVVERIVRGDRLLDYKASIEAHPDYPLACWADKDNFVSYTTK